MKISVFGLGYVGTMSAGCLAAEGHEVVGVDPNPDKVSLINSGKSPIIEKAIGEIVARCVADGPANVGVAQELVALLGRAPLQAIDAPDGRPFQLDSAHGEPVLARGVVQ